MRGDYPKGFEKWFLPRYPEIVIIVNTSWDGQGQEGGGTLKQGGWGRTLLPYNSSHYAVPLKLNSAPL
jgi:hypothetical protein